MFAYTKIDESSKKGLYEGLKEQVRHLIADEENEIANLANVASLIFMHLEKVNWVGFYLWYQSENQLILGPFQGKPACIRIDFGRGVCGSAAKQKTPLVVEDVFQFAGHITCDPDSRSEVVIPLIKDGILLGVLDIDSPHTHRFDNQDADGLAAIVEVLVEGTRFQAR